MTRINTNVSSLTAQKTLSRSQVDLQEALTRLSTGLKINAGKDDPAGLIASEALRANIISVEKAVTNSQRANQMIGTADSALGQVSALLNDIRGLVSEAANRGALSDEQIAANQLQIDSSLEAIDRISQTTQFQGKRLLDGSLDFITSGVDSTKVTNLQIDQANFGTMSEIPVTVEVAAQATQAKLIYAYSSITEDTVLQVGGKSGFEAFSFAAGSTIDEMAAAINLVSDALGVRAQVAAEATKGQMTVSSLGQTAGLVLTAKNAGYEEGNLRVKFTKGGTASTEVTYNAGVSQDDPGTINVALRTTAGAGATGILDDTDVPMTAASYSHDNDGVANSAITFTAVDAGGKGNDIKVEIITDGTLGADSPTVAYNESTKVLTIKADTAAGTTANSVIAAINSDAYVSRFVRASLTQPDPDSTATVNNGTGDIGALARTALAGGKGDVNNDLVITAKQTGTVFNSTNVHVINGNGTAAGIASLSRAATFSFSHTDGASNTGGLTFTSKLPGTEGNNLKVVFAAADANPATVTVSGNTITVKADTTVAGNNTMTEIAALINNDVNASKLVDVAVTGTGATVLNTYANTGEYLNNGHHAYREFAGTGNVLNFRAKAQGPAGEDVKLVVTHDAAPGGPTLSVNGNTITINLESDNSTTAAEVQDLFTDPATDQAALASRLVDVSLEGAGGGVWNPTNDSYYLSTVGGAARDELQAEVIEYAAEAKAAQASVTWNGDSNDNDIIIRAKTAGTAFNNMSVRVNLVNALGTTPSVNYSASDRVLTINLDDTTDTEIGAIKTAIEAYQINGQQAFEVLADDSVGNGADFTGGATVDVSALDEDTEYGNTQNTGGEAGTLFLYTEEGTTTANDIIYQLANVRGAGDGMDELTKRAAQLFSVTNAGGNDGTGKIYSQTKTGLLTGGTAAGQVAADAKEVIAQIGANAQLASLLEASMSNGSDGKDVVLNAFQEYAFYGSKDANNRLQFLGGADSADIQFVAGAAGSDLSVTDNRGYASMVKDSDAANSALVFSAKQKGSDFDGVRVVFVDDAGVTAGNEVVTYDKDSKTLKFLIDAGNTTANQIVSALAADDIAKDLFGAAKFGSSDGTGVVSADLKQASTELEFDGGAQSIFVTAKAYGAPTTAYKVSVTLAAGATNITFNDSTNTLSITTAAATVDNLTQILNADSTFSARFTAAAGSVDTLNPVVSGNITAQELTGGVGTDSEGNGVPDPSDSDVVTEGGRGSKMVVNLATDADGRITTTANDLISYLSGNPTMAANFGISASNAEGSDGTGKLAVTTSDIQFTTSGISYADALAFGTSTAVNGLNARIKVTADQLGASYEGVRVVFDGTDSLITAGHETASYDSATKTITVNIERNATTANQVIAAINNQLGSLFTAETAAGGDGNAQVTENDTLTLASGRTQIGTIQGAALVGNAERAATGLQFVATEYGSDAFVSVKALSGSFATINDLGLPADRSTGTDINARINGIQAVGKGLNATLNTSSLDLTIALTATATAGEQVNFTITGGGAQFQLGPDVVSNQQARMGIASMNTTKLGGVNGRLFELRSGNTKSLDSDVFGAASVVEEVIRQVVNLRGRLGAFQKTTLDTNVKALNDTLEALTAAESSIRDADFAAESARLTRAQILVQSGLSVLSIANKNPENVLALLRQ